MSTMTRARASGISGIEHSVSGEKLSLLAVFALNLLCSLVALWPTMNLMSRGKIPLDRLRLPLHAFFTGIWRGDPSTGLRVHRQPWGRHTGEAKSDRLHP